MSHGSISESLLAGLNGLTNKVVRVLMMSEPKKLYSIIEKQNTKAKEMG